jgi:hypothetical protein
VPSPDAPPSSTDVPRTRPWTLLAAASLVAFEAVVLLGLGAYVGVRGIVDVAESTRDAELLAAMAVLTGAAVVVVARGLFRARRWARTPAALTQVFAFLVAYEPLREAPGWRFPTLAVAVAAFVLLVARPTGAALAD